jgi:hypothetical protein
MRLYYIEHNYATSTSIRDVQRSTAATARVRRLAG